MIKLNTGDLVKVDDEDFGRLNYHKWLLSTQGYAERSVRLFKKSAHVFMHRELLETLPRAKIDTDHIDNNKLNNQKSNLRVATRSENNANRGKLSGKYCGVYYMICKKGGFAKGYWRAVINKEGKRYCLGYHDSPDKAALAYNKKAIELYGEYACLNKVA